MDLENIVREESVAEYKKIRAYVIDEIIRSGNAPMRLESNRDMARRFRVSRPTVIKALKDLIEDGFLTVKPGRLGTFTCPERLKRKKKGKIIGLVLCNGKNVFVTRQEARWASDAMETLMAISNSYAVQNIFLTGLKAEAAREIMDTGIDGLIWISPSESMRATITELHKAGVPQIAVEASWPLEDVCSVAVDVEGEYFNVVKSMLGEQRQRISLVLLDNPAHAEKAVRGWRAAHEACGLLCDESLLLKDSENLRSDFSAVLKQVKPDAICFCADISNYYDAVIAETDISEKCRLYSFFANITEDLNAYHGYIGYPETGEAMRLAMKNFTDQIHRKDCSNEVLRAVVPVKLTLKFSS